MPKNWTRKMIRADKPAYNQIKTKVVDTISSENHRQVFARLTDPIFNSGAMHGTPGTRKGKS